MKIQLFEAHDYLNLGYISSSYHGLLKKHCHNKDGFTIFVPIELCGKVIEVDNIHSNTYKNSELNLWLDKEDQHYLEVSNG